MKPRKPPSGTRLTALWVAFRERLPRRQNNVEAVTAEILDDLRHKRLIAVRQGDDGIIVPAAHWQTGWIKYVEAETSAGPIDVYEPAHARSLVLTATPEPGGERAEKPQTAENIRRKAIDAEIGRRILADHPNWPNAQGLAGDMLDDWSAKKLGEKPSLVTLRRAVSRVLGILRPFY